MAGTYKNMDQMINQYSKNEIEEFVWIKAGIHATDWQIEEEKRICAMQMTTIDYRKKTRRIFSHGGRAMGLMAQFTEYCESQETHAK